MISLIDSLDQNVESDWPDEITAAEQAIRAASAGIVSATVAQAIQRPFLKQYCKTVIGKGNIANDADMLNELYLYLQAQPRYVQSRGFTYGSPAAAGANVGNGQIVRLTKDSYNFDIENCFVESKRARCLADQNTGTRRGEEIFELRGQTQARDDLERSGSGIIATLNSLTTDQSLLFNASWSQSGGTAAAPTSITNWTASATVSSTNFSFDSTNFFRAAPSDGTTSYALNVKSTTTLTQKLSLRGTVVRRDRPYLVALAWNRAVGTASGTLVIRMGSVSSTVVVSAQTGWNITLCPGTLGQADWYRNWQQDDPSIQIDWTRTAGSLLLDDVLFVEGTLFDSTYYWAIPASVATWAPWRYNDEFTWADSAIDSKIQKWIWRAWNTYMPHSLGSSISFADP